MENKHQPTTRSERAKAWLSVNIAQFAGKNIRRYFAVDVSTRAGTNMLGMKVDQNAFEGKVIAHTDDAVFVKVGSNRFHMIDPAILRSIPEVGATVKVSPYFRREFSGCKLGEVPEEAHVAEDGLRYTSRTINIGVSVSKLPLPFKPTSPYVSGAEGGGGIVPMLESGKCTDGMRVISNMLVDCNAKDFQILDLNPDTQTGPDGEMAKPEVSFEVKTQKFEGRVAIVYLRVPDYFEVHLRKPGQDDVVYKDVDVFSLAATLEAAIDDGQWRYAALEVIKPAPKAKISKAEVATASAA